MKVEEDVVTVRGHRELYERTHHLFASARAEVSCAANDLFTWVSSDGIRPTPDQPTVLVRKLFRPGVLLDPSTAERVRRLADAGIDVRVTTDELSETIIIDRRVAILAGDESHGPRSFSVVRLPDVVRGVTSLFDAAWRTSIPLETYDRDIGELRGLAPRILELLGRGWKDEAAARALDLSVRTYRRRVAELMNALGASSRFQAGVRASELGLVSNPRF